MRRATITLAQVLVLLGATAAVPVCAFATWSIAAVDPDTGEAGVAVASCVPADVSAVAGVVPGVGATASQGIFDRDARDLLVEEVRKGKDATESATYIGQWDDGAANPSQRQHAVVLLTEDEPTNAVAAHSGDRLLEWAGDVQGANVSVQGNLLEGPDVIKVALRQFERDAKLMLPDRLLRALEAGSAAGGDRRCNVRGIEQTASSAALIVAREGDSRRNPSINLSVVNTLDRRNAVALLRAEYRGERSADSLLRPVRDPGAISVPEGAGDVAPVVESSSDATWNRIVRGAAAGVIALLIMLAVFHWLDTRPKSRSTGADGRDV